MTARSCPPPASSRPDERGSAAAWILALLVLAGVAFAVYWFVVRQAPAGSSALAARVLPAEVDVIGGVDIGRLFSDARIKDMARGRGVDLDALGAEVAKTGIKLEDLKSLVFGGRMAESSLRDAIIAVQASTDAKAAVGAVQALLTMIPEQLRQVVSGGRVEALDGGIVLTGSGELLDHSLAVARGEGAPLGDKAGLSDVRKALDDGAMFWTAAAIPKEALSQIPGMVATQLGGMPSHFGFSANIGSATELRAALHIPGADASKVVGAIEMLLNVGKMRLGAAEKAIIDNLELKGDGATLIATVTLSQAQIDDLLKGAVASPD